MNPDQILNLLRKFVSVWKQGPNEERLKLGLSLLFALAGGTKFLPAEWQEFLWLDELHKAAPWLANACWLAFAAGLVWLIVIWWRQLEPPGTDETRAKVPPPRQLVGARSWSLAQGAFFQNLQRRDEIDQLVHAHGDPGISLVVVRGDSGAGKTSLLKSGLAWRLSEAHTPVIYAEMLGSDAVARLLRAVAADWNASLVGAALETPPADLDGARVPAAIRRVLVLDQFEQLSADDPAHAPIFAFIQANAAAPPPHGLLIIVAFRREYQSDWQDFDDARLAKVPAASKLNLSVQYFTKRQAKLVLATLTNEVRIGEVPLTIDTSLADAYLDEVAREAKTDRCIAPVDIAICVMSLADRAAATGKPTMTKDDFVLGGGAAGMLAAFMRSKVQEIVGTEVEETAVYQALLRLVDPSSNRRRPEGLTISEAGSDLVGISPSRLQRVFKLLEGSTARLLDEVPPPPGEMVPEQPVAPRKYRLAHDRLAEAVRRLGGNLLADELKAQTLFDNTYWGWRELAPRLVLRGRDLRLVEKHFQRFKLGADAEQKRGFLKLCQRRRLWGWGMGAAATLAVVSLAWIASEAFIAREQRADLRRMGLPGDLYDYQKQLHALRIHNEQLDSLAWLRGNMTKLTLRSGLTHTRELRHLPGSVKTLDIAHNEFRDWSGLSVLPRQVESLILDYPSDQKDQDKKPRGEFSLETFYREFNAVGRAPAAVNSERQAESSKTAKIPATEAEKAESRAYNAFKGLSPHVKNLTLQPNGYDTSWVGELPGTLESLTLSPEFVPTFAAPLPQSLKKLTIPRIGGWNSLGEMIPKSGQGSLGEITLPAGGKMICEYSYQSPMNGVSDQGFPAGVAVSGLIPVSWYGKVPVNESSVPVWIPEDGEVDWEAIKPAPREVIVRESGMSRARSSSTFALRTLTRGFVDTSTSPSRFEEAVAFIKKLPPSVKRLNLEWNLSEVVNEGLMKTVPATVQEVTLSHPDSLITFTNVDELPKLPNIEIVNKLPPTVTQIHLRGCMINGQDFRRLPARIMSVELDATDPQGHSIDLKDTFSQGCALQELRVRVARGFGDLSFLQNLKQLRHLALEVGSEGLASDSLRGLPASVRELDIFIGFGPWKLTETVTFDQPK
ncbi:MAG: ATP-binding protein [Prosthecobacter sp.]|nr:ATP-binding protein [Prosthecobacter sp.]